MFKNSKTRLTEKCELSDKYVRLSCFKPGDPNSVFSCNFDCQHAYPEENKVYCELIHERCSVLSCSFDCKHAYREEKKIYCGITGKKCYVVLNMIEQAASVELKPNKLKSHMLRKIFQSKTSYKKQDLFSI